MEWVNFLVVFLMLSLELERSRCRSNLWGNWEYCVDGGFRIFIGFYMSIGVLGKGRCDGYFYSK